MRNVFRSTLGSIVRTGTHRDAFWCPGAAEEDEEDRRDPFSAADDSYGDSHQQQPKGDDTGGISVTPGSEDQEAETAPARPRSRKSVAFTGCSQHPVPSAPGALKTPLGFTLKPLRNAPMTNAFRSTLGSIVRRGTHSGIRAQQSRTRKTDGTPFRQRMTPV
ncbi:hypothetical protein NDU88_006420 [Pleurodeles waltl]|uniref:Uncharacterized protein n=1 Tax=Pleurodeles waltl TaxID=8319 RepID=A0AAV7MZ54_PLEWA|nr:hypothetical protein NDU88_006420 [Pleurodeles waltl]